MQTNKGLYSKNETLAHMFMHSCLGRMIMALVVVAIVFVAALFTVPADEKMKVGIMNGISECISANYEEKCDKIDDAVRNFTSVFSSADSIADSKALTDFNKYNSLEIRRHSFYSTMYVRNNLSPTGIRVGIGFMGMVIPTVTFGDLILNVGPVRKDYNQRIIRSAYGTDDLGNNPDFGNTYNTYQGGGSADE